MRMFLQEREEVIEWVREEERASGGNHSGEEDDGRSYGSNSSGEEWHSCDSKLNQKRKVSRETGEHPSRMRKATGTKGRMNRVTMSWYIACL